MRYSKEKANFEQQLTGKPAEKLEALIKLPERDKSITDEQLNSLKIGIEEIEYVYQVRFFPSTVLFFIESFVSGVGDNVWKINC